MVPLFAAQGSQSWLCEWEEQKTDIACVGDCAVEASHSPEKELNPAL